MIFLEGVGDVLLPCAAAIVVPGFMVALAGGRRALSAAGVFAVTVGLGLWLRAGGLVTVRPNQWVVAVGFLVAAGLFLNGAGWAAVAGSVAAGAMAAWMWQPCVGIHLGEALTTATRHPWASFLPLVAYGVGLSMVPIVVGALVQRGPFLRAKITRQVPTLAAAALGGLAVISAAGWYEEIVARLLSWSVQ